MDVNIAVEVMEGLENDLREKTKQNKKIWRSQQTMGVGLHTLPVAGRAGRKQDKGSPSSLYSNSS